MRNYIVILESDNSINTAEAMETVSTLFMSNRVIQRNILHIPKRIKYKNKIDLIVESKCATTEYQQKKQEYILEKILNINKATVSEF